MTTINTYSTPPQMPGFGNPMFNQGGFLTPDQQRIQTLEQELAQVKAKLAEKDAATNDIDKALEATPEGCAFLRARYDGVTKILTEWAMANPMLSQKVGAFLEGWKKEAKAFLDKAA